MSALASISLNDALPTPVAHSFIPVSHSNSAFIWRDSTAGLTVLSAPTIALYVLPTKDKSLEKFRTKVTIPVLETITGQNAAGYTAAPRLGYTLTSSQDFILPIRATTQQKQDLVRFAAYLTITPTQISDALYSSILPY